MTAVSAMCWPTARRSVTSPAPRAISPAASSRNFPLCSRSRKPESRGAAGHAAEAARLFDSAAESATVANFGPVAIDARMLAGVARIAMNDLDQAQTTLDLAAGSAHDAGFTMSEVESTHSVRTSPAAAATPKALRGGFVSPPPSPSQARTTTRSSTCSLPASASRDLRYVRGLSRHRDHATCFDADQSARRLVAERFRQCRAPPP
jgi:hypothetical protein